MSFIRTVFTMSAISMAAFGCSDSGTADLSSPTFTTQIEANPNPVGEAITLRLNLEEGTTWSQLTQLRMSMNVSMDQLPEPMNFAMAMSSTSDMAVTDLSAEGIITIESTIRDQVIDSLLMNGQKMPAEMMGMGDQVGTVTTGQISTRGEILGLDMGDIQTGDPEMDANIKEMMTQLFEIFGNISSFPEEPVHIGDKWTHRVAFPNTEDAWIEITGELLRIDEVDDHKIAVIDTQGLIHLEDRFEVPLPESLFPPDAGMKVSVDQFVGGFDGEVHLDMNLGHSVKDTTTMNMETTIAMQITTPQGEETMEMAMEMNMSIENETVDGSESATTEVAEPAN